MHGMPCPSAKAKAKAKAMAVKNLRRSARRSACQSLNELAIHLHVSGKILLQPKNPDPADVEKLVRLLEKRVQSQDDWTSLSSAEADEEVERGRGRPLGPLE